MKHLATFIFLLAAAVRADDTADYLSAHHAQLRTRIAYHSKRIEEFKAGPAGITVRWDEKDFRKAIEENENSLKLLQSSDVFRPALNQEKLTVGMIGMVSPEYPPVDGWTSP